jgi:hypothetical protein
MSKLAPEHWRDRAKEARAKAEQVEDPRSKRMMLGLADFFEGLAERIEVGLRLRESESEDE